ncbi:PREDICTED: uncharacterized protein LOC109221883 [Nicotiana attenuata]|uniref:uncharacterized protein LOC109220696 n=1 Tax=Nicotiana attenuata TaxID=49451 RepID=UPI000904DF11|nr:PREDICTED: uncharacterized protein LOC109220696 [Nicotiana attenuata]XP_019241862.1 PREDICTED: uncharacterized protein LOC109221883 [Nicotiana attenuata]
MHGLAGIGGVFRNHSGDWLMGFAGSTAAPTITERELMGLLRGLQMAIHLKLHPLEIYVDSLEVINILYDTRTECSHLITDCRSLLHQLYDPPVKHTYMEQNIVADRLAHFGSNLTGSNITFFAKPPPFLWDVLTEDRMGMHRQRQPFNLSSTSHKGKMLLDTNNQEG